MLFVFKNNLVQAFLMASGPHPWCIRGSVPFIRPSLHLSTGEGWLNKEIPSVISTLPVLENKLALQVNLLCKKEKNQSTVMEVSVGYKACKRDSLGTEIVPLAQSSDHSNTTDFTPRQLWSRIRTRVHLARVKSGTIPAKPYAQS